VKILIVEDEKAILSFLKRGFEEEGYVVDTADIGQDGEYKIALNHYDIIILDWMLPEKSGIEILKCIRKIEVKTPVILLTAKDEVKDKVEALKIGADDYVAKPFSFEELEARVESLYRRSISKGSNTIEFQDIIIDIPSRQVTKAGSIVELLAKEYDLLLFLIKNKNCFVSADKIYDAIWGDEEFINSNVIQVIIYRLRKKLGKDLIKSSRGLGYKIEF